MPSAVVNGRAFYWREAGSGPPVILLMGLETDHRGWFRLVPHLAPWFHCISPDNRDVGRSGFASAAYERAALAEDTLGLMDQLGIESAAFIGQSMGGAVAQVIARRAPERVKRLVLISSFAALEERSKSLLSQWKTLRRALSLRDYYAGAFLWMYTRSEYDTSGLIETLLQRATANPAPQPYDAFCRQVDAVLRFDSRPWLRELSVETLIVSGDEDLVTPPANAHELAASIPKSGLLMVEQSGHGLVLTGAINAVGADICQFLM